MSKLQDFSIVIGNLDNAICLCEEIIISLANEEQQGKVIALYGQLILIRKQLAQSVDAVVPDVLLSAVMEGSNG